MKQEPRPTKAPHYSVCFAAAAEARGFLPNRAQTCPAAGRAPLIASTRGRLNGNRALHVIERDVAGSNVDLSGLGRHPAAASTHLHAALQANAAARYVDLEGGGFGFDALEPDRDVARAAGVANDRRFVVAHVDLATFDFELAQDGVDVALQNGRALGDVDVEMVGANIERLAFDDRQWVGVG